MSATATASQSVPVSQSSVSAPVAVSAASKGRVVLNAAMPARVIAKHLEAGVTDTDALVTMLTTSVYPVTELVQLAAVLGAEFAEVLAAQQGLAVATVAKAPAKKACTVTRQEFLGPCRRRLR